MTQYFKQIFQEGLPEFLDTIGPHPNEYYITANKGFSAINFINHVKSVREYNTLKVTRRGRAVESVFLINKRKKTLIVVESRDEIVDEVYIFSKHPYHKRFYEDFYYMLVDDAPKPHIKLVLEKERTLVAEDFKIEPVEKIDLELSYGKRFVAIDKLILESLLGNSRSGLVLLHGVPGTGKTYYLRHLVSRICTKMDVIYVNPMTIGNFSTPTFLSLLSRYPKSILIIEDSEHFVSERDGSCSSAGVSDLLNLSDGLLGDCLRIKTVCTFNTPLSRIDKALLRKGRLIAHHEFDALEPRDAEKLFQALGRPRTVSKPMTLADIYNAQSPSFDNGSPIGFQFDKTDSRLLLKTNREEIETGDLPCGT